MHAVQTGVFGRSYNRDVPAELRLRNRNKIALSHDSSAPGMCQADRGGAQWQDGKQLLGNEHNSKRSNTKKSSVSSYQQYPGKQQGSEGEREKLQGKENAR